METIILEGGYAMDMEFKRIRISSKRQVTIPQKFFEALGFDDAAECTVRDDELIIRPVSNEAGCEFADLILEDLIKEGYSGDELLVEFKARQKQIRPAVKAMLEEAEKAARGEGEFYTYEEVFGEAKEDEK